MADSERGSYDLNVGKLVFDYQDFTIMGNDCGFGYRAQMRSRDGKGHVGPELAALTLDGLAVKMDEARADVIRLDAPDESAAPVSSLDQPLVAQDTQRAAGGLV